MATKTKVSTPARPIGPRPKPTKQDIPDETWSVSALPKPKPPRPTGVIDPNKIDPIPADKRTMRVARRRPSVRAAIPSRGYSYTESDTASGRPAYVRRQELDNAQMAAQATRQRQVNAPARQPTPTPVGAPRPNSYHPAGLVKSDKLTGTSSAKVKQMGGVGAPLNVAPPKKKKKT